MTNRAFPCVVPPQRDFLRANGAPSARFAFVCEVQIHANIFWNFGLYYLFKFKYSNNYHQSLTLSPSHEQQVFRIPIVKIRCPINFTLSWNCFWRMCKPKASDPSSCLMFACEIILTSRQKIGCSSSCANRCIAIPIHEMRRICSNDFEVARPVWDEGS